MSDIPALCGNCFHQWTCWVKKEFSDFIFDGDFHIHIDVNEAKKQIEGVLASNCTYYVLHTLLEDYKEGYWKGIGQGGKR